MNFTKKVFRNGFVGAMLVCSFNSAMGQGGGSNLGKDTIGKDLCADKDKGVKCALSELDPSYEYEVRACTLLSVEPIDLVFRIFEKNFENTEKSSKMQIQFANLDSGNNQYIDQIKNISNKFENSNVTSQADYNSFMTAFEKEIDEAERAYKSNLRVKQKDFVWAAKVILNDADRAFTGIESLSKYTCSKTIKEQRAQTLRLAVRMRTHADSWQKQVESKIQENFQLVIDLKANMRSQFVRVFGKNVSRSFDEIVAAVDNAFLMFSL